MAKIFIDGKPIEADDSATILQAAEKASIPIPHFCYHEAFPPEGSCRMCLVEIEGLPKLELACSTRIREGMKVFTQSEKVIEARKGVLEFLLADHPIDCPICDKAGECMLQDYYEEYGLFESQFEESKERREKKVRIGKNLILDQERCILCTRCVRFLKQVTKTQELGVFERGIHSEINIYNGAPINNNYSGNLTEICPVGAITDSDFRFQTRAWFLQKGASICPLCSRGCNIYIEYHRGFPRFPLSKRVYRIKARENPEINSFWICDIGRYGYRYLNESRLLKISLNNSNHSKHITWENIFYLLSEKIKKLNYMHRTSRIAIVLNTWLSNEDLFLAKRIFKDDLKIDQIFTVDNPQEKGDQFLLTEDRSPNRVGAQELGFSPDQFKMASLHPETEFLLAFDPPFSSPFQSPETKAALERIETKVLFTAHANEWNDHFDIVLPTALIPEKEGSLTNVDGKIQRFSAVFEAWGEGLPEWKILVEMAKQLKLSSYNYKPFSSPEIIFQEMKKQNLHSGKAK
jgi:NADH-quinone oxidoreductase subunit G